MSFLLPIGLAALLVLPLIVALHLLRERRRRVTVPSLLLWQQVPRKRDGTRARQLPLTWLLLLHLLIAGLLALALAQPQLLSGWLRGAQHLAIVIDTSTSMAAVDGDQSRMVRAQAEARSLIQQLGSNDQATLISAGPQAHMLATGGANDPQLLVAIDGLQAGGSGADLEGGLTLAEASFSSNRSPAIVVLTDGSNQPPASRTISAPVDWRILSGSTTNRAIVNFASRTVGNTVQVYARIANYDNASVETGVQLFADDRLVESRSTSLTANGETELTFRLPAGAQSLRLAIDGGDALAADDSALINLAATRTNNVLLVSAQPEILQRALNSISSVQVSTVTPSAYPNAPGRAEADLTIFDNYLPESWPAGAVLAINPPIGSTLLPGTQGSQTIDSTKLTQQAGLLDGLSFGGIDFGPVALLQSPEWASTLLASGSTPLILRGEYGQSDIAIWAFSPAQGNLPNRLAFPLLMARTVRDLTPQALPQSLAAGSQLTLETSPRTSQVNLTAPDGSLQRFTVSGDPITVQFSQPGWYQLVEQGDSGEVFTGRIAVNAGSPLEANLQPQPAPTLTVGTSNSTALGAQQRNMTDLWPWLLMIVLMLLAFEWLYVVRRRAW